MPKPRLISALRRRRRLRAIAWTVLWLLVATAAVGANVTVAPELAAKGWQEFTFDGKTPNRFKACAGDCVEIETDHSVSMLGRRATVDLGRSPTLRWQWKIAQPAPKTDLTRKGHDDRAVAVYVTFPYDPATASLTEKILRPLVELVEGADAPSRMLSYVWAGYGKRGDLVESPFFGGVNAMIVMRTESDAVGRWITERVDVVADHERAFGRMPKTAAHVLLGADSDDTRTHGRAYVRDIRFGVD